MNNNRDNANKLGGDERLAFARKKFVQVVVDDVNWKVLWRDPSTGELWKEHYPHSDMHGGGPPQFVLISEEDAGLEFEF